MTLEQLRAQRARDMLAVIDAAPTSQKRTFPVALRAASARELEWLEPAVALRFAEEICEPAKLHATVGIVSPFTPSILVVTYTARYYLAGGQPGAARRVYLVYSALQEITQPESRGLEDL